MVKKIKHIIGDSYWAIVLLAGIVLVMHIGCGELAPTVQPNPISQQFNPNDPGSLYPRVLDVYPTDGSTDIPVDTSIIIVFNKPIDITTITPSTIVISGVSSFNNISTAQDNKVIIIVADTFSFNQDVDITITTAVRDSEGNPLLQNYASTFQTGLDDSSYFQPKVVASTRFPTGNSVSRDIGYVEVTFTKDMDEGTVTVDNFGFTGPATSVTKINSKTYELNINTLSYAIPYTVNLSSSIKDIDGNNLDLDGNHTWQFTTEPDPATILLDISDVWITNVTNDSITIQFTTTKPVAQNQCYAVYGMTSPVDTSFIHILESVSTDATTLHKVTISSLSSFTRYYIKAGINTDAVPPVEILSTEEVSTYTNTDSSNNSVLSNAYDDQYFPVTLQTHTVEAYVFWLTNKNGSIDIYGQYFDSNGNPVWGVNGAAIASHTNNQQGIVAITNGFSDAIIVYNDTNNLYAKMIYNNGGLVVRWGGTDINQGTDLNIAIKPGSSYSATLVHEQPEIIVTGTADMPDNGTATNLLYDADVDFSAYSAWLDEDDLLLTDIEDINDINWTPSTIQNQSASPFDMFPYVIKSTLTANLSSLNYYIADSDTSFSGTANSGTTTTELRSSTDFNFLLVHSGDIIHNTIDNEWGFASSAGQWDNNGYYKISIDRELTNLNDGDTYTIYLNPLGPFTSEAVANPLWDVNPNPPFNPGITVLENDIVVNENNNTAKATYATISAIDLSKDTNYALRLSNDIMNNGDRYAIIRMQSGATIKGVGYSTSIVDFELGDSNANFTGWSVQPGDIVYNIDTNLSAMVKTVNANILTISADIFNATNDKYILYTKRAFLVAYIDNSNNVMAKVFSIADGSQINTFAVCTHGTNSNPIAISDEAGNAMIFYEKSGNIYGKKVSAKGQFFTSWGSDADEASDIGRLYLNGFTIVQALPDKNMDNVGGAYLLARNPSNTQFRLLRISGVNGNVLNDFGNIIGSDPMMVVDSVNNEINRAIIVYRNTHITGGITYYHIEARAYRDVLLWGPIIVSSNIADYNCVQPVISMADNSSAADNFYIAWFDARYYATNGYSIFIQRYNATPTQQWVANGLLVSFPSSYGYDYPLSLKLIYWYDGGSPYGAIPIWLDHRDYSSTNTDIYYQRILDNGYFFP
jgi:hypothetical protein